MAIKLENIDQKIDVQLSEVLRKHTTRLDRIQVASLKNLQEYELKSLVYREIALRNKHVSALTELIRRARKTAKSGEQDVTFLDTYL